MQILFAAMLGLLFGLGLILAGMANPAKVQGFLDITGMWDPSLALVMAGAIGVGLLAFWLARRRSHSWLGLPMQLPTTRTIDQRLILGSITFGIGWGLAGICPGPALLGLGMGRADFALFVLAMLLGMGLFELLERNRR